jgi:hypothetical protein
LTNHAFEHDQIRKSGLSQGHRATFLPPVEGNAYAWLRFEGYLGNVGSYVWRGLAGLTYLVDVYIDRRLWGRLSWSCGLSFLRELWLFARVRRKYWLLPILLAMALLGGLIVFSEGSAVAPLIYTIF